MNECMRDQHYGETKSQDRVDFNEGFQKRRNKEKKIKTCGLRVCSIGEILAEGDLASVR
jgi:hypothetical protein